MDLERAIETQRLRLLRLVAGLVVAVEVLSVGPFSRGFSVWFCGFIGSILYRAEVAARYLVIAEARRIAACRGLPVDHSRFSVFGSPEFAARETEFPPSDLGERLRALRAVLLDLPRHARNLVRRTEKQTRRTARTDHPVPQPDTRFSTWLHSWRLAKNRIERPPDIDPSVLPLLSPPPGFRAGGALG